MGLNVAADHLFVLKKPSGEPRAQAAFTAWGSCLKRHPVP
jgi:hypothetical protein